MVKSHLMYLDEAMTVQVSPPNCSSAVLHWTCLFNIFGKMTWQQRTTMSAFEPFKEIAPLKEKIMPAGFTKNLFSGRSEMIRKKEFWNAIEKGDMEMLWKILLENRKFVYMSGTSNEDFSPVHAAIAKGQSMAARLLLFFGSPPEVIIMHYTIKY